ncbi:hypothetical protein [Paenibacillus turpanensis]|uniref:hypothetical protein n=1 Tax=Paenibacillus turpanensis TaxID=2689078 RepID=UPI001FB745B3|nr:hypothetical protein [Paenibacillus turpanensis]
MYSTYPGGLQWSHMQPTYQGVQITPQPYQQPYQLKQNVLSAVEPFVQYGLREAKVTSVQHAFREVAAIAYLMGAGVNPNTAYRIVESWEINEVF